MQPLIVLVGPPGAGKSTVGQQLADLLGTVFTDTDEIICERAGKTVSDIFVDEGEEVFRELECAAVTDTLESRKGVVSLGGGAVMTPAVTDALERYRDRGGRVVFLDVSLAQASKRIGFNASRPLLLGNPRAQWQKLMGIRRPVYQKVSDHAVVTDHKTPAAIAEGISQYLNNQSEEVCNAEC